MEGIRGKHQRIEGALAAALLLSGLTLGEPAWSASTIAPMQFRNDGDSSLLTIKADGPISYTENRIDEDNQYVIEITGAQLGKGAEPRLPTSSFPGKVRLVSAYKVEGVEDTVRVVLTLAEPGVEVRTSLEGNQLNVSVPVGNAAAGSAPAPAALANSEQALDPPPADSAAVAVVPAPAETAAPSDSAGNSDGAPDMLGGFLEARDTRRFVGSPITIQVRDMEVVDVLRMIGGTSGFNVVADGISGKITLELVDVPWDQALDVVLTTKQLGAERNNNILRIVPLQSIRAEKEAELAAKVATEANAPKVTRIFPISYAELGQIKTVIEPFLSKTATAGGSASGSADSQPLVQTDARTNSLIVRDLPTVIERVKKLIDILDTQTPQILIEGKIVESSTKFSKSLGGELAVKGARFGGATMGTTTDALFGESGSTPLSGPAGGVKFGIDFGILGLERIKALLAIEESEGTTKVISSPRLVVANGKAATITSSLPVAVPKVIASSTGAGGTGLEIQNAELSLNVTPTAANDGFVKLLVTMTKGTPESAGQDQVGVASKSINTEVYVESGSTLSIGGVYSVDRASTQQGIPFLRNIPVLGWLFGKETERDNRSELFIFISPRILNERESMPTTDSV